MRVLFLQQQPCIRALKYAVGLRAARSDIQLGFAFEGRTLSEWYGTGDELFDGWWRLDGDARGGLRRALAEFRPDLVHSHNLPDSLTVLALALAPRRLPVVHDVHDLQSLRRTPSEHGFPEPENALALEKRAVEGSAAVVTVSEELLAEIRARHRVPAHTLAFPNYALERDLPRELPGEKGRETRIPRLVYQGTVSTNGGHYDLRDLFTALVAEGVELDIYPGRPAPAYAQLAARHPGMRCHPTLDPLELLSVLPEYDFGWAGFNAMLNAAHLDTVLPNKVYEYMGCGLPFLTLRHRALARLVRERGVGVSLGSVRGVAARLAALDVPALRRRVASARTSLTVEANIARLVELYETLVRRSPAPVETTTPA